MKQFVSIQDVKDAHALVKFVAQLKKDPYQLENLGKRKTLGLVFLNPSLRTRLSTQKAANHLGMDVLMINISQEGWTLETKEGAIMNGNSQEHIKEAIPVISQYCDVLAVRTFPSVVNKTADYGEETLQRFIQLSTVPVISLESATLHPLQSLADMLTIEEKKKTMKPKIVLTWAPHPKALPQSVANSFLQWCKAMNHEVVIAHPKGMKLAKEFVGEFEVVNNQEEALKNADFVYAKNWSSYEEYGQIHHNSSDWTLTSKKMALTNEAYFMHCLPVRRNVVVADEVIDSEASLVIEQANNRTFAAQAVLAKILGHEE